MSTKTQSHWLKAGVADEWVTQLLRQGDTRVFKKYSQMNLQMKNEALQKLERQANMMKASFGKYLARWHRHRGSIEVY
jgi:hypothetical protein